MKGKDCKNGSRVGAEGMMLVYAGLRVVQIMALRRQMRSRGQDPRGKGPGKDNVAKIACPEGRKSIRVS